MARPLEPSCLLVGPTAGRDVTDLVITTRQHADASVEIFGYYVIGVCLRAAGRLTNPGLLRPEALKLTECLGVDAAGG